MWHIPLHWNAVTEAKNILIGKIYLNVSLIFKYVKSDINT